MKCTRNVACGRPAVWRISVPTDPWPLQYACDSHALATTLDLGGDVRLARLEPGQPTPEPRSYLEAGSHKLRVATDSELPPGRIELRGEGEPIPLVLTSCPSTYTTSSPPKVSVSCQLADMREAHRQGIHLRDLGDRVCRWPVTDFDRHRWKVST